MANQNSRGQQRDKPFRDALRKQIAEMSEDPKRLERIAVKLLTTAEAGDIAAIKEVADRLDGKVAQSLEHSGVDGSPIEVKDMTENEAARLVAFTLMRGTQEPKPH